MKINESVDIAFKFRKAVESYYDFVIEITYPEEQLIYDKEKFKRILDTDKECNNMDELFWFIVSNYIHPEDLENVDVFREKDINRRLKDDQRCLETEFRIKIKGGEYIWISCVITTADIPHQAESAYVVVLIKNIDKRKKLELESTQLARRDAMTRLYNKTYVQHIIIEEMEKSDENSYAAMLIIDIDNFKYINDMYGHLIGDKVIVEFANRLLEATREDDIVGRVGGDEFIVYIKSISSKDALKHKLQRLISNLEFQFVEQEVNTHICCSIGATLFNSKSTDYIEAYKKADSSLYLAKDNGKNTYRLYD